MNSISSIKVVIRKDKKSDMQGKLPLALQIIINSKAKKISLKEKIHADYWDDVAGKAKGKGYRTLNVKFDKIKSDIQTFCSLKEAGGIPITFDLIDNFLSGKNDNDFYQLYDDIVSKKNLRVSTKYKYTLLRQRLRIIDKDGLLKKSMKFLDDSTFRDLEGFMKKEKIKYYK